jgi:hypothetical protein
MGFSKGLTSRHTNRLSAIECLGLAFGPAIIRARFCGFFRFFFWVDAVYTDIKVQKVWKDLAVSIFRVVKGELLLKMDVASSSDTFAPYTNLHGVISPSTEIFDNNTAGSGWPWCLVILSFICFSTIYLAVRVPSFVQLVANIYLTQWMLFCSLRFVEYDNKQYSLTSTLIISIFSR